MVVISLRRLRCNQAAGWHAQRRARRRGRAHLDQLTIGYAARNELAGRVWELRRNVTPYDAAYLALAEARNCRLVTTDGKLRDCPGRRCDMHVVTPGH
jgi:predicted nucleic acid-binding protein